MRKLIALLGVLTLMASAFPSVCAAEAGETSSQAEESESGSFLPYLLTSGAAVLIAGAAAGATVSAQKKNKNGANRIT